MGLGQAFPAWRHYPKLVPAHLGNFTVMLTSFCVIQGPLEPLYWVGNRALEAVGRNWIWNGIFLSCLGESKELNFQDAFSRKHTNVPAGKGWLVLA